MSRRSRWPAALLAALVLPLAACSGSESDPALSGGTSSSAASTSAAATKPASPTATGTPQAPALARLYAQKPDWRGCGDDLECATVIVPVDYAQPEGATASLSLLRRPASDADERIGSLLVNPGGPGGSGVEYARAASRIVSSEVLQRYDIVGFDPRGVASSTPIRCLSDEETDAYLAADGSPDDAAEELATVEAAKDFGTRCAARRSPLLAHVSTRDAARDMDLLRAVLGDDTLHFLGKSYGTMLGATYADLFPTKVGRMVLDGAIDPNASSAEVDREQAKGFELALSSFVVDCLDRDSCPLEGPKDNALRQVDELLEGIDSRPLRGDGQRLVTQSLAVLGVAAALYDEGSWPVLRQALAEARDGNGMTLLLLADAYSDRGPDGRYRTNSNDAIYAVNCLDRPRAAGVEAVRKEAAELERVSPIFGTYIAWSALPCASWPAPATGRPHEIAAPGAAPIVVVGTVRDPATPLVWARSLARQLSSGVLITWDGDGHTAYRRGSECVDRAVDRYLLEGMPPAEDTRCD